MTVDKEWFHETLPLGGANRMESPMRTAYCKLRANVIAVGNCDVDMIVNNIRLGLSVNTTVDKKSHPQQNAHMNQKIRLGWGVLVLPSGTAPEPVANALGRRCLSRP